MKPVDGACVVRGFEVFINVNNFLTIKQSDYDEVNVVCVQIWQAEMLIEAIRHVLSAAKEEGGIDDE